MGRLQSSFESLNIPRNYVKNGIVIIFMVVHHKQKINNSIKIDILVINGRARYKNYFLYVRVE